MKKFSKKILALILTFALVLGMLPAAMADETDVVESIVEVVETKKEEPESQSAPEPEPQLEANPDLVQEEKAESVQEEKAESVQEEKAETPQGENDPLSQQETDPDALKATPVAKPELPRFVIDFPDDAEAEYTVGDIADEWVLAAEVSDGGKIAYQWFTNEPDEHGELKIENLVRVQDADSARHTPETDAACETYYCLRAVNTLGSAESEAVYSKYIKLTVLAAQAPLMMLASMPEESLGQVRVIVENTTFLEENDESYGEPAWTGTLLDMKVDLHADSTMMSCLVDALEQKNFTQYGAENNYVETINGLSAFDGGFMSGWMGTLNDWFCNEGFGGFSVAAGTLEAGDVIRIMYTCEYGEDLGGSWGNTDTSLKALAFSDGALTPEFDSDTTEYTLAVPADCEGVSVSPEAANKNYLVRVYKNTVAAKEKGYKADASITVEDGDTIFVVCGHPDFPSMNESDGGHTYAVKIAKEEASARLSSLIVHTSTSPSAANALLRNSSDAYTTDVVFDPETFEYTLAAQPDTTTQLRFRPVPADDGASVKLTWNGGSKEKMQWTSGTSTWANCVFAGDNTLMLTVSAEGKKSTDYVLHIQILPTLTALEVICDGTPVTLDPAFKAATNEYAVTVPETAKTLTLDATPKSPDYTLKYDGAESNVIDISDPSKTSISIAVGTGEVQNIYTVSLNRVAAGKVFFKVLPGAAADAKITVSDAKGNVAAADADGGYTLMLDTLSYTWQASKYGYVTQKGDIPTSGGTVEITMQPNGGSGREDVDSDWNNFRNSDTNMGITDAKTPTDAETTALLWNATLGSGWSAAPSVQIIVDDTLIVMSGTTLYKLDLETGETLATGTMAQSPSYGYTPPTYAEGLIFCPLGNGTVQAFDAKTLESVWLYQDPQKGQSLSPITYSDGYVYTGFWNGENKEANFVCISVSDDDPAQTNENKLSTWSWKQMGGFYWAGSVVIGDYLVVGTDDGASGTAGDSTLYAFDKKTGEIVSSLKLAGMGDQRSSIAWDVSSGKVYFSTKGGYLCSAKFDKASGMLSGLTAVNNHAQSTSTPVVYDGKVYYATGSGISSSGSSGNFVVADADSLELLYGVGLLGYPQCSMLLSTAYEEEGYLYFYSTYNSKPGGISLIKVKKDGSGTAEDAELIEVYDAKGFEEYCITSIICDKNGNLYYKNDSGNVFAVGTPTYGQVIKQINKIGDVTEDSLTDIETARAAYEALSEEDQAKVSNIDKLEAAEEAYADLVEAAIDAIGEVTPDSEETIAKAQAMYDAMTPDLQEKVENADKLAEAAKKLSDLKVAEAEKLIDAIPDSITNANKAEAQTAINAAKAYYNGLSDAEKARVSNYADIAKAEAAVKKLRAGGSTKSISIGSAGTGSYQTSAATNAVVMAINDLLHPAQAEDALPEDMRDLSDEQKDTILDIERKYRALSDDEQLFVSNYGEFEEVQQAFGEANHTDPETGIRVSGAPWHIALILKPLNVQDELKESMQTVFGSQGRLENLFWVSLVDLLTGETVEMTELMRLEIPATEPEAEQTVIGVYIGAGGKLRFVEGELLDDYLTIPIGETDCWYGTAVIDGSWDDLMNGNILIEPGETLQNWLQWLAVTVEIVHSLMK